jgi:tetratricopeptide (TPR) repeat protein
VSRPYIAPKIASSRLSSPSDILVGRDEERAALDVAWRGPTKKNVVTIVAWGGTGKTALAARWAADTLAKENHGGIERYFDWSFYSQGSGDDKTASANLFIKEALEFFGDRELAAGAASGWQKGERLAQLVAEHRTLLILDGLEPLQDAKSGDLRDDGLRSVLRGLAAHNGGLCLVTTRQSLPELNTWHGTSAPEWKLERLSKEAGGGLLAKLGVVKSTPTEREELALVVKGHALTLTLLGKYLAEAHGGDIRQRDLVSLSEADFEETKGHAFHVIAAYEKWLERDGRLAELAILRLLGLFDRPATPDCFMALRQAPPIVGLTDLLVPMTDAQWNVAMRRLVQLGLIEEQLWEPRGVLGYNKEQAEVAGGISLGHPKPFQSDSRISDGVSIDAHPLVREYFACRQQEANVDAWQMAHARLFEHLRSSVPYWPEGLDGLQPLYQAVAHGCQAGKYEEARAEVYRDRIMRGTTPPHDFYSVKKLGAIGENMSAVGCFFVTPWTELAPKLTIVAQAWLLGQAAYYLRALGRLKEARDPLRTSMRLCVRLDDWENAATNASNLAELELTLGDISSAVRDIEQGISYADRSKSVFWRQSTRCAHANALQQADQSDAALQGFEEAEVMHSERQPQYPLLWGFAGFQYCDFLLAPAEREAWRSFLGVRRGHFVSGGAPRSSDKREEQLARVLQTVEERARKMFDWRVPSDSLLDIAFDCLTLGRVTLYREILEFGTPHLSRTDLEGSVEGIRQSGDMDEMPRALLSRAWLWKTQGLVTAAHVDIDEAEQIAERGSMRLHLADVYLHRARLFFREELAAARADLTRARKLIIECGYLRRKEELEDAERVILA